MFSLNDYHPLEFQILRSVKDDENGTLVFE